MPWPRSCTNSTFAEVLNYLDGLQQAYAGDAAMLQQVKDV